VHFSNKLFKTAQL